jgi:hypothetical protein
VRLAHENPDEWEGASKQLLDYVGIATEEVLSALHRKRQGSKDSPKPALFQLDDQYIDNLFAERFGVKKEPERPIRTTGYGSGLRQQVFEVIVRQAIAGAPWKEICDGPMRVNGIKPEEIEAAVAERLKELGYTRKETNVNPRAIWGLPSQHRFKQLQTRVEQALSKPLDLNEKLVQILKKDLDLRKLIVNMILHDLLIGSDWDEGLDRWIRVYEITAREIEDEIRRRVRGEGESGGPPLERVPRKPHPTKGDTNIALTLPRIKQRLVGLRDKLAKLLGTDDIDADTALRRAIEQVEILIGTVLGKQAPETTEPSARQTDDVDSTADKGDVPASGDETASGS